MRCVNLGCGSHYHPDWINIDLVSGNPDVITHDLSQGIPLPDTSCDVVYHSHVLEHFRREDVLPFMQECYRVLKPGGIIRIATPDLERICRVYLEKLEMALSGDGLCAHDYEWITLEMYDQTVREQSGGRMLNYLRQNPLPNEAFVYERIGQVGRDIVSALRELPGNSPRHIWFERLKRAPRHLPALLGRIRDRLVARLLLGAVGERALAIGRFRLTGKLHHWMYDRYSLAQLMLAAGFRDPIQQSATSSLVPYWDSFNLDTLSDGVVYKPDSIFMEAIKPNYHEQLESF